MTHPSETTFEAYVLGTLEPGERAAFVRHVATCDACSERLEREARVELALFEVRARLPARARPRRVPRIVWPAAAALALAAAWFLFVRSRPQETALLPAEAIPFVECRDLMQQPACIEAAHRHGLYVAYPAQAGVPPLGGGASSAGPSSPPFRVAQRGEQ